MKDFKGVIIEESLKDKNILKEIKIISTKVENVTEKHKTPWLKKWTLHEFEINTNYPEEFAQKLSKIINSEPNSWYVDFNNKETFFVVYPNKVFKWGKGDIKTSKECLAYGISLGIPTYQVDFPNE